MKASLPVCIVCLVFLSGRNAAAQPAGAKYLPPDDITFSRATIVSEGSRVAAERFSLKENDGKALPTIIMLRFATVRDS